MRPTAPIIVPGGHVTFNNGRAARHGVDADENRRSYYTSRVSVSRARSTSGAAPISNAGHHSARVPLLDDSIDTGVCRARWPLDDGDHRLSGEDCGQ